jgi:hypothetical protein
MSPKMASNCLTSGKILKMSQVLGRINAQFGCQYFFHGVKGESKSVEAGFAFLSTSDAYQISDQSSPNCAFIPPR